MQSKNTILFIPKAIITFTLILFLVVFFTYLYNTKQVKAEGDGLRAGATCGEEFGLQCNDELICNLYNDGSGLGKCVNGNPSPTDQPDRFTNTEITSPDSNDNCILSTDVNLGNYPGLPQIQYTFHKIDKQGSHHYSSSDSWESMGEADTHITTENDDHWSLASGEKGRFEISRRSGSGFGGVLIATSDYKECKESEGCDNGVAQSDGDANGDCEINDDDYNYWKNQYTGACDSGRSCPGNGADFDGDNKVTLKDFEKLRESLFDSSSPPPQ